MPLSFIFSLSEPHVNTHPLNNLLTILLIRSSTIIELAISFMNAPTNHRCCTLHYCTRQFPNYSHSRDYKFFIIELISSLRVLRCLLCMHFMKIIVKHKSINFFWLPPLFYPLAACVTLQILNFASSALQKYFSTAAL